MDNVNDSDSDDEDNEMEIFFQPQTLDYLPKTSPALHILL